MRALVGFGVPYGDISMGVQCSPPAPRKCCRHERDVATIEANTRVAQTLSQWATTPGIVATTILTLKDRAGWREKQIAPADGAAGPLPQVVVIRRIVNLIGCEGQASEFSPPLIKGDVNDPDR